MKENVTDSVEEPSEMAFQLLAEWWIDSVQALIDSVGSGKAIELLRPHYINAGIAGCMIVNEAFNKGSKKDLINWYFNMKICADFLCRRDPRKFKVEVRENGLVSYHEECPFKDGPIEICTLFCDIMPNATILHYDPSYEKISISRLSLGDQECRWMTKPKSLPMPSDYNELGQVVAELLPRHFPKNVADDYSLQYLAEFWVISTRAFIEQFGNIRSAPLLKSYMKLSGVSFGLSHLSTSENRQLNVSEVNDCISSCSKALHMIGDEAVVSEGVYERTIQECPFKGGPPEVCMQFESFCQGICEAVSPDLEFSYDRMMTRNGDSCHWTIKNKSIPRATTIGKAKKGEPSSLDPIKELKLSFVRKEITEEEYRRMKKVLEE